MNNTIRAMVWFVGAGPGDPELITVKGQRLVSEADVIIYAGALIPPAILQRAQPKASLYDSTGMSLDEMYTVMRDSVEAGLCVVRLHAGDSSVYAATREQKALLDASGIPNAIVPGISAAFAAAASAGVSFTVLETIQSLAITRLHGKTPTPRGQRIQDYVQHGGSLAIYLSAGDPKMLEEELVAGGAKADVPLIVASRVGWPDEHIVKATVGTLTKVMNDHGLLKQVVVLVLPGEKKL